LLVEEGTQVPKNLPAIRMEEAWKVSALAEWHEPSVSDLEWTPDEALLAVSNSSSINLYDVETRRILRTLYPSKEGIVDFAFSPGGLWLVVGTRQGDEQKGYASSLELWSGPNWRPLGLLYGVTSGLNEMTFTPKGDYFAVVYANPQYNSGVVDFWQTASWSLNTSMDAGAILNVAISADGIYLATSPNRYNIQIWDLERHEFIYRIPTSFTGAVNRLVFAPDSGVLASGHYDGMVRLWDLNTSELLLEFDTGAVVESLAFSPDGQILASGGSFEHSNIQLWSAGSGALLRVLENPSGGIHRLSFSPDSQYLVSASYNGTLRLWGIRP
jgi:WD40 repeat protein